MIGFLIGLGACALVSLLPFLPHPWTRVRDCAGCRVWRQRGFRRIAEITETGIPEAPFRWWTRKPYGNGTIAHSGFAMTFEEAKAEARQALGLKGETA